MPRCYAFSMDRVSRRVARRAGVQRPARGRGSCIGVRRVSHRSAGIVAVEGWGVWRRWLIRIAALVAATIVVAIAAVIALVVIEPRPAVEFFASQSLDRRVTASNIKIGWGEPLTLEISKPRGGHPPSASEPRTIRIQDFSAHTSTPTLCH